MTLALKCKNGNRAMCTQREEEAGTREKMAVRSSSYGKQTSSSKLKQSIRINCEPLRNKQSGLAQAIQTCAYKLLPRCWTKMESGESWIEEIPLQRNLPSPAEKLLTEQAISLSHSESPKLALCIAVLIRE